MGPKVLEKLVTRLIWPFFKKIGVLMGESLFCNKIELSVFSAHRLNRGSLHFGLVTIMSSKFSPIFSILFISHLDSVCMFLEYNCIKVPRFSQNCFLFNYKKDSFNWFPHFDKNLFFKIFLIKRISSDWRLLIWKGKWWLSSEWEDIEFFPFIKSGSITRESKK